MGGLVRWSGRKAANERLLAVERVQTTGFLVVLDDLGLAARQAHKLDNSFEQLARRATGGAEDHNLQPKGQRQTGAEDGDPVRGREGGW